MKTYLLLGIIFYIIGLPLYYFFLKIDHKNPDNSYKNMIKHIFENGWGTLFILLGTYYWTRFCFDIQTNDDITLKNAIYTIFAVVIISESIERYLTGIKKRRQNSINADKV